MFVLRVKQHFDSAHKLKDYKGKCKRSHGHRWYVELFINCEKLNKKNLLVDFKDIKEILNGYLPDHRNLNKYYKERNPTAEFLAKIFYWDLAEIINCKNISLQKVVVWESENCAVEYSDQDF